MAAVIIEKPRISIVIAVFNGGKTLQPSIDSIAGQTYPDKELIVMDGMSVDDTVPILERNTSKIKYWESKKDRGIAHAWNKGLEHVTGNWILFLGSDDRLHDEAVLSDMAEILQKDPSHDLVYGKIIFEGGSEHGLILGAPRKPSVLKRRMCIPHTAAFHRKKFLDEVGSFDETFRMAMDYELLLRKCPLSTMFVDRLVTVMGGEGISSRLIQRTMLEGRAAQLKNRVTSRFMIEAWHAYYQLLYLFNKVRNRGRL